MGYCNEMLLFAKNFASGGFIAVTVYSCCCCHIVRVCSAIAVCITMAVGSAVAATVGNAVAVILKSCFDSEDDLYLSINIHDAFQMFMFEEGRE